MIVALRTAYGESEPYGAYGVSTVHDLLEARLFAIDACFPIRECIAMEPGGDFLLSAGIGQHVARQLLDGELIERHVFVQRVDHPLSPTPRHRTDLVLLIAIAIGVSRQIEPRPRPLLTVMGRCKKFVDEPIVSI